MIRGHALLAPFCMLRYHKRRSWTQHRAGGTAAGLDERGAAPLITYFVDLSLIVCVGVMIVVCGTLTAVSEVNVPQAVIFAARTRQTSNRSAGPILARAHQPTDSPPHAPTPRPTTSPGDCGEPKRARRAGRWRPRWSRPTGEAPLGQEPMDRRPADCIGLVDGGSGRTHGERGAYARSSRSSKWPSGPAVTDLLPGGWLVLRRGRRSAAGAGGL
jgi:hypothetical protein